MLFLNRIPLFASAVLSIVLAQDPNRPYPLPDAFLTSTDILNHTSYLTGFDEPQWYLDNIPFVDVPDSQIQEIYYYRTSVLKRHLAYTHQGHGWIFTEFIQPVPWSSKFQSIPDSAAHQIVEARWLRDPSYVKDTIQTYTRGGCEELAGITYTHYIHDAILEFAEASGDLTFLTSQLDGMIKTFGFWNVTRDNTTGLYHRTPLLDAQEYSLPGWVTGGPNGGPVKVWNSFQNNFSLIWLGPETYRPNFNAYMIAGARAISTIASLAGNNSVADEWNQTASKLYSNMQNMLWSNEIQFWIDVVQGTNLDVVGRQLVGLFPYRFDVGTDDQYIPGLEASLTPDVFVTEFGPTTLEQSSPYYTALKNTTYCCLWQGQSWPFSTCVYLGTLARLARENRSSVATPEFFNEAFSIYTRTHYKDGSPFIGEVHYPTVNEWSGYTTNHSEHYLHSTYIDNLFTNLLGLVPTLNNTVTLKPLVPSNWTYFAVESLPYHGTLLSILYDADGSHYTSFSHSPGLSIYSNGSLIHNQPDLTPLTVPLPNTTNSSISYLASAQGYVNILANPNFNHSLPNAAGTATFFVAGNNLGPADDAFKANDGLLFYDNPPDNFYSNNQTGDPASWLNFTMPRKRTFNSITIAVYDDSATGGAISCPAAVYVMASNRTGNATEVMVATRDPWDGCQPNARNTLSFDGALNNSGVTADTVSLYLVNALHYAVAIPEVEIWVPSTTGPRYEAEDGLIGLSIQNKYVGTNGSVSESGDGVVLGNGGMLELADVRTPTPLAGRAGTVKMTMIGSTMGGGSGEIVVGLNYLANYTVTFGTNGGSQGKSQNVSLQVDMLAGGNVVTMWNLQSAEVFIDAFVLAAA